VTYGARLRELRAERQLSLRDVEERGGPNKDTMSLIERDVHKPHPRTLGRIAEALDMNVSTLRFELESAERPPLGPASPSQQLTLNGELEEERRAAWEAAAEEARRLRETGWAQMWKALSGWRASKDRGEPYATRREYLDEIGSLLQEVYDADVEIQRAYLAAALTTKGGSEASGPRYLQQQSRKTGHFYGKLLGLVERFELSVRTGEDAAAAKQAAADDEAAAEHVSDETRPLRVEESEAA
jgi:transcriptional regulator with XRE-family HTH domain